jgi:hypothetical protein
MLNYIKLYRIKGQKMKDTLKFIFIIWYAVTGAITATGIVLLAIVTIAGVYSIYDNIWYQFASFFLFTPVAIAIFFALLIEFVNSYSKLFSYITKRW